MRRSIVFAAVCAAATLALAGGCADPVRSAAIAALGPEDGRVPPGPLHRPGQPCLVCHVEGGPATPLSAAGTVFRLPSGHDAVADATVLLVDSAHRSIALRSNCAGNFFVYPSTFAPRLPLWASLGVGEQRLEMESPMNRDGDCAGCHADPAGPASEGQLFVAADERAAAGISAAVCP